MDGAAAPGLGFGLCAGGDLVTELLRSRLVGLRQKGFTPAAGRQRAADPAVSEGERKRFAAVTLALHSRRSGAATGRMWARRCIYMRGGRHSLHAAHTHVHTRRCHLAQCVEESARVASQRSKPILLEYRRGLEREKHASRGFGSVLYKKRQKKSREAVSQFSI